MPTAKVAKAVKDERIKENHAVRLLGGPCDGELVYVVGHTPPRTFIFPTNTMVGQVSMASPDHFEYRIHIIQFHSGHLQLFGTPTNWREMDIVERLWDIYSAQARTLPKIREAESMLDEFIYISAIGYPRESHNGNRKAALKTEMVRLMALALDNQPTEEPQHDQHT